MPRRPLDRLRLVASYVAKKTSDIPGPSALMVETTVRCNLQCPMCPRTGGGYPNADMPDALLWRLLDDHARLGGDHIYLYGLGEPLLDRRTFELVSRARALGLHTILSTNGTLLDARRRHALLESGCDHLLVGIDGASEETYAYYRAGGNYARVVSRLEALAREKIAAKSHLTIVVQFIRMAQNAHEVDAFLARWRGVPGIDEVRIKSEDIGLPEHRTSAVDGERRQNPCHFLWRGPPLVRYTGEVFACYHHAGFGRPVGNLNTQSLQEIWDAEPMRKLRTLHAEGRPGDDPCCRTCPAVRPRLPFVLGAMALRGKTVRRLIPIAEKAALKAPWLLAEKRSSKL